MNSRTSLVWMGVWALGSACAEPIDYEPDDDDGVPGLFAPQGDEAGPRLERPPLTFHWRGDAPALPMPCAVDLDAFPARVGFGAFGDIAFDDKCAVLVAGAQDNRVYRIDSFDRQISVVAEDFQDADTVIAVAHVPSSGHAFVSTSREETHGQLFLVGADGKKEAVLALPEGELIRAMAVAPENWGRFGGQLIVVWDGSVRAVEPSTYEVTEIATLSELLTDLSFTFDGAGLYVADYFHGQVHLVTAEGRHKTIVSNLQGVDGVVAGRTDDFIYVNESQTRQISRVDCGTAEVTPIEQAVTGPGPGVTGMLRDKSGAILFTSLKNETRMLEWLID